MDVIVIVPVGQYPDGRPLTLYECDVTGVAAPPRVTLLTKSPFLYTSALAPIGP